MCAGSRKRSVVPGFPRSADGQAALPLGHLYIDFSLLNALHLERSEAHGWKAESHTPFLNLRPTQIAYNLETPFAEIPATVKAACISATGLARTLQVLHGRRGFKDATTTVPDRKDS